MTENILAVKLGSNIISYHNNNSFHNINKLELICCVHKNKKIMIRSKSRGSLLGMLIGDCCGSPFKGQEIIEGGERIVLRKYFDRLEGTFFKGK